MEIYIIQWTTPIPRKKFHLPHGASQGKKRYKKVIVYTGQFVPDVSKKHMPPYKSTNVMQWILFIRQILLLSSTCFEYQVLIFRRT